MRSTSQLVSEMYTKGYVPCESEDLLPVAAANGEKFCTAIVKAGGINPLVALIESGTARQKKQATAALKTVSPSNYFFLNWSHRHLLHEESD